VLATIGGVPCAELISLVTSCPTLSAGSGDPPDGREIAGASRVLYRSDISARPLVGRVYFAPAVTRAVGR
jgi:hypothetical protein